MWFQNILSNPEDKQYKNYFAGNPAADKLFETVGFQLKGNFLEFESKNLDNLKEILEKITEGISTLSGQMFSNSAPWQLARPAEKLEEKKINEKKIDEREGGDKVKEEIGEAIVNSENPIEKIIKVVDDEKKDNE